MSGSFLVTGSSRGIGAALARDLLASGNRVFGVQRSPARESEGLGDGEFSLIQADLSGEAGIAATLAAVPCRLDGIVLNAGIAVTAEFEALEIDGEDPLQSCVNTNLLAPLKLVRALMRADKLADSASCVFISSNLAHRGLAGKVAYSAAKAGLEAAVRALARELGPRGMRVNAVAPGLVATKMTVSLGAEGYAAYAEQVPLGRVGQVEDIVGPIQFLLNSGSEYISGTVLTVDGGWSC